MHCPFCKSTESRVVDSRISDDGFTIRRRRLCPSCNQRFSTLEKSTLYVVKRSGILEEFNQTKLLDGVRKAISGRGISEDCLNRLAQEVEDRIRSQGVSQIDSYDIGLILLEPLKELDVVAYLRYASVYQGFDTVDDYERAIADVRKFLEQKKATKSKLKSADIKDADIKDADIKDS